MRYTITFPFGGFVSAALLVLLSVSPCLHAAQVKLSWQLPTNNVDGTPLTDLAGCKVYYGLSSGNYSQILDLPGPVTNCTVTGLQENVTYYFNGTSYNSAGLESDFCNEVAKAPADTTPPTMIPPGDTTMAAQPDGTASIPDLTQSVVVSDNRSASPDILISQTPVAGTSVGLGITVVNLTARDEAGNSSTCTVNVVVAAGSPPSSPTRLTLRIVDPGSSS